MTGAIKVVLLSAEYPPMEGGIGDYTRRLGLALQSRGDEVSVLTSEGAIGPAGDPLKVFPLVEDWGWGCLWTLSRFLRQHRFAVLHVQYQTGAFRMHPAIHFLPDLLRLLPRPPRLVVTMHDLRLPYLFPKAGRLRHLLVSRLLRLADAVVVTNGADWERLGARSGVESGEVQGYKERDLLRPLRPGVLSPPPRLIPLGSSLPPVSAGYDRAAWRARLLSSDLEAMAVPSLLGYFGLLHPSKGADLLVEALARIRESRPVYLIVIGGGTGATDRDNTAFQGEVRARIDALELGDAVRWTGPCPAEEAASYLRACDLVVMPYRDGASFRRSSLVAALAVGCPVITTEPLSPADVFLGSGLPVLEDGDSVALVPRGEIEALSSAIVALLEDPEGRQRLAEGAGQLGQSFQWAPIGRRHRKLYAALSTLPLAPPSEPG
jgi:glycosyltransferase involved in cell wall biosynthesis